MIDLKRLVAKKKKLEAQIGAEVKAEQKEVSAKEGKRFEAQMIKEEKAKIRRLQVEAKVGKYARKGSKMIQKGKKVHGRISRGLSTIQGFADKLQPRQKKKKGKRRSPSGFDFPI